MKTSTKQWMTSSKCETENPKRRLPTETRDEWLVRLGFEPLTEEDKRANLEYNLMFFCDEV